MATNALPPGQYEFESFPRFGLRKFAYRFPKDTARIELKVGGDVGEPITLADEILALPRVDQTSDFHCVTTWSRRDQRWSGFRFRDLYQRLVVPRARPHDGATFVIFKSQDGYATQLPLEDLMADDVLLADRLNGEPLGVEHGAPLRLVAPAHYGYKNAKHISTIEFWRDESHFRSPALKFMDHPRARVALEERGIGVPGVVLRYLYRPLVRPAAWLFRHALKRHRSRGITE